MAGKDEESNQSNDGCGCNLRAICHKLIGLPGNPQDELIEVHVINSYAVYMGYLSMAVRGLAFMVVTWTTVVLLGGFVSVLGKKDFWCLTMITLSQSVGVFDIFLKEKLSSMWHAYRGLLTATTSSIFSEGPGIMYGKAILFCLKHGLLSADQTADATKSRERQERYTCLRIIMVVVFWILVIFPKAAVQAVLFAVILLPLSVLYLLGLPISTAISLWRLVQHDYEGKTADGSGNLKPALNVLYSLTLLQGVVFCYKFFFSLGEMDLVQAISKEWKEDRAAAPAVREYLRKTRAGCEKDPSFARWRNLATYAVDLIESSNSPHSYLSGMRILDILLNNSKGHRLLIRHLVGWGSTGHVLHKLLGTIGSESPYDAETRKRATSIVKHLAKDISLEQLPGGIRRISSMLDDADTSRVKDGLRIIGDLAAGDEDNRRVISSTQGLVTRVVALLGDAEGLHRDHHHHDTWDGIACIIAPLIADQGVAGVKVRRQVSTSNTAVGALESVLKCVDCSLRDRLKAIGILVDLSLSAGTSTQETLATTLYYTGRREENLIIGILADSFFPREGEVIQHSVNAKNRESREVAGIMLAKLSLQSKSSATIILTNDDVVSNLISMLLAAGNNSTDRKSAAEILKNLCSHYTKDDKCFDGLKRALTDAMPKVLREVSGWSSTGEEIQEITGANCVHFSGAGTDLEKGCALKDDARNSSVSPSREENREQDEDNHKLKETLLSLYATVWKKMASVDEDLARRLDEMAAAVYQQSRKPGWTFASLVKETKEKFLTGRRHEQGQNQDKCQCSF